MIIELLVAGLSVEPAEISSAYAEPQNCVELDEGPAPVTLRCEGYGGWVVYIGASDHSASLAYSDRAWQEQLQQNPIQSGQFQSFTDRIEWRVRRDDDEADWEPFATIHRWTSSTLIIDEETGEISDEVIENEHLLVVSALRRDGPIGGCHVGYIDVRSVYDSNTIARVFTDAMADGFRCGVDEPYFVGAGEALMLQERGRL